MTVYDKLVFYFFTNMHTNTSTAVVIGYVQHY